MKLAHIAIVLTVGLVGVMVWLVMDARTDAKTARNKLDLYERRGQPDAAALQAKEDAVLLEQLQRDKGRTAVTLPAPTPLPPAPLPPSQFSTPAPASVQARPAAPPLAASPHISSEALNAAPAPVTPQQRMVINAPAIANVKEVHGEAGFVIITAGTSKKVEVGMKFSLRRLDSVVGRIKITEIDNGEAVGDLEPHSVPTGVTLEIGDDVIQDIPQE
jgi:hypothetical protein